MIRLILTIILISMIMSCSYRYYLVVIDQSGTDHSVMLKVNPIVDKQFELSPTLDIAP